MRRIINILGNRFIEEIFSSKLIRGIIISIIFIIVVIVGFFISEKNYFYGMIFYPDKTNSKLIYERRAIIKGKNRKERLDNIVSELLLGPVSPEIKNYFTREAKLINSWLEKDKYYINLTEETLMNIEWRGNIYELVIKSIVNSVCINDRKIKEVYIYFNSKEYNYVGNVKLNDLVKPDWKILLK